ncbi:tetratricopeptide repeat protein [Myxococcota bacterium]|nr:tetratricopeptide repeat protein [Myxococcota bacterium]
MGEAARGVGDLDAAEGWYTEAMAGWAALGDTRGEAISRVNLALLHLARGQLEDARELAQRARESFAREGNRSYVAASDIVLAEIAAGRGDLPEAEARLAAAAVELGGTGFVHEDLAEMLEDLGTRAAASGRHGLARSALDLAARQWERLGRADRADRLREEPVPAGS